MRKPNFDIEQLYLSSNYDTEITIDFNYTLYNDGVCTICFDIPSKAPVFFKNSEGNSNSISKVISNPVLNEEQSDEIEMTFVSSIGEPITLMIEGTITDFKGKSRSDYFNITLKELNEDF